MVLVMMLMVWVLLLIMMMMIMISLQGIHPVCVCVFHYGLKDPTLFYSKTESYIHT